jgi:hypothetical protein
MGLPALNRSNKIFIFHPTKSHHPAAHQNLHVSRSYLCIRPPFFFLYFVFGAICVRKQQNQKLVFVVLAVEFQFHGVIVGRA